jgi:3-phenylpropionate/cinnamic acid dioxygenase small subunit
VHLSAPDQIRNLLAQYCTLVDAADFDGVGQLMAHASLQAEDGTEIAGGAEAVADLYRGLVKVHADGTPRTKHLVANTRIEPEDDGTVTAYSSFVVLQATDSLPLQPVVAGDYLDRFAQGPDGSWHFVQRRFSMGLPGDLSQHMDLPPQ